MKLDVKPLDNDWLRFEPLGEAHGELLRAAGASQAFYDWMPMIEGCAGLEAYLDRLLGQKEASGMHPFAIFRRKDDAFAGVCAYAQVSRVHRRVRIGHVWHPGPLRGSGVFQAGQLALIGRAVEAGARRVEWYVDERNTAMRRALERFGLAREGVMRDWQRLADGSWSDVCVYALMRADWPGVKARLVERLSAMAG